MSTTQRYVEAHSLSEAWVRTVELLASTPRCAALHVATRIAEPGREVAGIRALVDELLQDLQLAPVRTVANTIFPTAWAERFPEPADLSVHYRNHYPTIRRFQPHRAGETYFGRLVAFPHTDGNTIDQLSQLTSKLRSEARKLTRQMRSRYEVNVYSPSIDVAVYDQCSDSKKLMGFPCLSFCSFHLFEGRLHLAAHYRSQYLIERGYGNYLGLCELQRYVAQAVDVGAGELLVVAGHAQLDAVNKGQLGHALDAANSILLNSGRATAPPAIGNSPPAIPD